MKFTISASSTLLAATARTAVRFNTHATARRARFGRILVADSSITSTDEPIICRIYRNPGAAGSMTSFTPVLQFGSASGAVLGTAQVNAADGGEGTVGSPDLLAQFTCPTGSEVERFFEDQSGLLLEAAVNSNIILQLTAAQARTLPVYYEVTVYED